MPHCHSGKPDSRRSLIQSRNLIRTIAVLSHARRARVDFSNCAFLQGERQCATFVSYILAGALVVLLLDVIAPPAGFGLGVAAWPSVEGQGLAPQIVDRTHKVGSIAGPEGKRPSANAAALRRCWSAANRCSARLSKRNRPIFRAVALPDGHRARRAMELVVPATFIARHSLEIGVTHAQALERCCRLGGQPRRSRFRFRRRRKPTGRKSER